MMHHPMAVLVLGAVLLAAPLHAARLPRAAWTVTDQGGKPLPAASDNDWQSVAQITGSDFDGCAVAVDLGSRRVLHRLFLTAGAAEPAKATASADLRPGGPEPAPPPKMLRVLVGDGPQGGVEVARIDLPDKVAWPLRLELDRRFAPVAGRYVRLLLTEQNGDGYDWRLAELELWGVPVAEPRDAVVVAPQAAAPLCLAAEELSYYLTELTDRPVPVRAPGAAVPGITFELPAPTPTAPAGSNVVVDGRTVSFPARSARAALVGVWEFLRRQGVCWAYPDSFGDLAPPRPALALQSFTFSPSASARYANFDTQQYDRTPPGPDYLFWWRNGYDSSWGGNHRRLLGPDPETDDGLLPLPQRPDRYREGFDGYPHNFHSVLPPRIVAEQPTWQGKHPDGSVNAEADCCYSEPAVAQFISDKILALTTPASQARIALLPVDAVTFCECARCQVLNAPRTVPPAGVIYHPAAPYNAAGAFYAMVAQVAANIAPARPGVRLRTLAYANLFVPPPRLARLPDNVEVQVCQYGARNLPIDAPANAAMRTALEAWHARSAHLSHYDYVLLAEGNRQRWYPPVPAVAGIVSRAQWLQRLGALDGGTQATLEGLPYNPWNYYAYPRLLWDATLTREQVLDEFFPACFGAAAAPVRAYYETLESYQVEAKINLSRGYGYALVPGAYPVAVLAPMQRHLAAAEQRAADWALRRRLAPLREALDGLLGQLGLAGKDLDLPQAFPTPATFDWRALPINPDNAELRGQQWRFYAGGQLGIQLYFATPGRYRMTVQAAAKPADDEWPSMTLSMGAQQSPLLPVTTEDAQPYTADFTVAAGVHLVTLTYRNAASGGRRWLTISNLTITPLP